MTTSDHRRAERPPNLTTVSHTHRGERYTDDTTTSSDVQVTEQDTETLFGESVTVLPDELPDGYCKHGSGTLYSTEHKKLFPAPCNRWRVCPPCRRWLAARFALQIEYEALNAGHWFGWFIVARDDWGSESRDLRRHGMRYRAFPIGSGDVLKVVTRHPEPGENRMRLDGQDVLWHEDKLTLWVYRQLVQIADDKNLSASHGFGGPRYKGTRPTGSGRYKHTGKTPEQVKRDLLDAALTKASTHGGWIDKNAVAQLRKLADSGTFVWPGLSDEEAELAITTPTEPPMSEILPQPPGDE